MFTGALALWERSLRIDARSWQTHLARLGLLVAIYVSLSFAFAMAGRFGAPGLRFFSANVYLNVFFLTLLGVSCFSTTITEEKEEDTLGLMLMAGVSPLGLLIGKLGGRLVQTLLLIAVQYPFTLLAITLGGEIKPHSRSNFTPALTTGCLVRAALRSEATLSAVCLVADFVEEAALVVDCFICLGVAFAGDTLRANLEFCGA